MKILVDMNLSPDWKRVFTEVGWQSMHWADVGPFDAPDAAIMRWALQEGWVVFTHDLDFGAILAATGASGPSVVQLRAEDTRPSSMGSVVLSALLSHRSAVDAGAILTVDPRRMRVTLLPLQARDR